MQITILGGGGFLGRKLAARLGVSHTVIAKKLRQYGLPGPAGTRTGR